MFTFTAVSAHRAERGSTYQTLRVLSASSPSAAPLNRLSTPSRWFHDASRRSAASAVETEVGLALH